MKQIPDQLQSLLQSGHFLMAEGYYFTLIDGTTLRYGTIDINAGWSHGYCSGKILFRRTSCSWKNDLSVDSMEVTLIPTDNATINGVPFLECVKNGTFDGATCTVERFFMKPDNLYVMGGIILFVGRVGEIEANRTQAIFTINSQLELLNVDFPLNVFESSCGRTLYGVGCGIDPDSELVKRTVTVGNGSTKMMINLNPAIGDFGYTNGMFQFTSGRLNGTRGTIKQFFAQQGFKPLLPLVAAPDSGDTIDIWLGCDKTLNTCHYRFANTHCFRGFPFIPTAEYAF